MAVFTIEIKGFGHVVIEKIEANDPSDALRRACGRHGISLTIRGVDVPGYEGASWKKIP